MPFQEIEELSESVPQDKEPWEASHLAEMYERMARSFGALPALSGHASPTKGRETLSYEMLYRRAVWVAEAWIELGLQRGDKVLLLADNRLEWLLCSMSLTLCGAVDVPRGNDATDDEIAYIWEHSGSRFAVVEGEKQAARVRRLVDCDGSMERLVLFEGMADDETDETLEGNALTLARLETVGRRLFEGGSNRVIVRMRHLEPGDILTIIYTSGTTGRPKGVVLSHGNMMSQVRNLPIKIEAGYSVLSILPVWHSYERAFEMLVLARGVHMQYASVKTLAEDLKTVRPQVMVSAPRLWESLHNKILKTVRESSRIKRGMFALAYKVARVRCLALAFLRGNDLRLREMHGIIREICRGYHLVTAGICWLPHRVLDRLVFRKIRGVIGGRFLFTVSGGGALPLHIDEFLNSIGIPVLEGYGMTESSPVLSVRLLDHLVIGTVGPMYPETQLRIVDLETREILYPNPDLPHEGRGMRGEIHVAGPQVMQGYYRNPEETDRVLQDGWLNTGDIGIFTFNNCLKIVGRSKDTIVLRSGENLEPVPIENRLGQSPLVQNCMLVGQDEKCLGLLIVPDWEGFRDAGLAVRSVEEVMAHPEAEKLVDRLLQEIISREKGFKSHELIHTWRWVGKSFEVGDELTSTFKLRRHVVTRKYQALLREMFHS